MKWAKVTPLIINGEHERRIVDGLLTGMHIPGESHIKLLEAFTPLDIIEKAYSSADILNYQWHEYGDLTLILNPINKMKYGQS